jgi:FAD/FMN-containing dehydrogenase
MAFDLQTEIYLATYVVSSDPDLDGPIREWVDSTMARMQPVTAGQYLGDSDFTNRQVRFMSDEHYDRLQQIRAAWDPDGRFVGYLAADGSRINGNHWETS